MNDLGDDTKQALHTQRWLKLTSAYPESSEMFAHRFKCLNFGLSRKISKVAQLICNDRKQVIF